MRHIEKTTEPADFIAWKTAHTDKINDLFAKYNAREITKSEKIWAYLPTKQEEIPLEQDVKSYSKMDLRAVLVNEQGGICAYCGGRILANTRTRLEHVASKSRRIEGTFDYFNIVAACSGGQYTVHTIQKGDTLEKIAEKYATTIDFICRLNPDLDCSENAELEVKIGNAELEIKIGTENINVQVVFDHCDVKKGSNSIAITPLHADCQSKFKYDMNGTVYGEGTKDVIDILGLNDNPFIVEKRMSIRERIRTVAIILIRSDPRKFKTVKQQKLEQLYANSHQFEEMAFVHEYAWNTF